MAFALFVAFFALLVLAFPSLAFPASEVVDGAAAVAVVLNGEQLPARAAVVVVPIVVGIRARDDSNDIIVAVAMQAPRADFLYPVFHHSLLSAMVVDLSQIRRRTVQLMDEMDPLVMFAVALVDCGLIEALLRFVASEIPCLGLIAVEASVTLGWGQGPFVGIGRG